jgi:hypothetical protein
MKFLLASLKTLILKIVPKAEISVPAFLCSHWLIFPVYTILTVRVVDPYSFFTDPDPDPVDPDGDQYGSGSGSNADPGL